MPLLSLCATLLIALLNSLAWVAVVLALFGPLPLIATAGSVAAGTGVCLVLFAVLGTSSA